MFGAILHRLRDRGRCALASLRFAPGEFTDQQFIRYVHYVKVREWLQQRFGDGAGLDAIEFGGSNHVILRMIPAARYSVAPNYPEVDVVDLSRYAADSFDLVVVDQVLEHVSDPQRAVAEIHRVLRPGGHCIATTPFLIEVHGYPSDFHRFTGPGLARLFRDYDVVEIDGWGNRHTVKTIARYGWLSARNTRRLLAVALWNEAEWPVGFLTIARKRAGAHG
jgi:SAM-dependent methyltransferase